LRYRDKAGRHGGTFTPNDALIGRAFW